MADNTSNTRPNTPNDNANQPANKAAPAEKGPKVETRYRLHHAIGGGHSDFDSESDALKWVKESATVKQERQPDGSVRDVYSPNAHLVHGAAHPDFPNLRIEKVSEVVFPEDEN